jgi:hypothetical protein
MDDPTDDMALVAIASATGLKVRAMIASPSELRNAIEERYFGKRPASTPPAVRGAQFGDESTGRVSKPGRMPTKAKPEDDAKAKDDPKAKRPPPPPKPQARVDGAVPVDQYAAPSNPPGGEAPGRTLTLLDGTRVKLPSNKKAATAHAASKVRHVVKAVSAASAELGASAGPLRWHDIVQAVIDAAAARGVTLSRKEIGDAWKEARAHEAKAQTGNGPKNA